jgi:PAS domain S-box-containing protein
MNQTDQLRLFIEQAPVAMAMFDREMRYVSVSRRWLTDYNLGEWDLTGLSHYDVFPEITGIWKDIHRRCLAGEVMREDNDRFERADGSVQWLRWEVRPWRDDIGNVGGIIIFSEDITARKHAEEGLLESEARFRTLVEEAPEALFVHSDGHVKYVNPAFLDLMGAATPEDLLDRDILLIIAPEYHDAALNHIKHQKERGMGTSFVEREYLRTDGSRVPVEASTVFIKFQGCDAHLVFVRNISERKRIEGRLLKNEELYRIVADFTYDWEYWIGTDGRFRYISPSVERITGYSVSDFQEDSGLICRIIHPQDRRRMEAHISAIHARNVAEQNLEYRIVTKSGEERWLSHSASLFPWPMELTWDAAQAIEISQRKRRPSQT